jgi:hypothetical protein
MTACYKQGIILNKMKIKLNKMKIKLNKMKIKFFKHGVGNSWELNFIGTTYNLRIARHQIAFWKNYNPIINWSF